MNILRYLLKKGSKSGLALATPASLLPAEESINPAGNPECHIPDEDECSCGLELKRAILKFLPQAVDAVFCSSGTYCVNVDPQGDGGARIDIMAIPEFAMMGTYTYERPNG